MLYCHPTLSFKGERQRQILHGIPVILKLKILRDSANSDRFHHNHFNLDIGLSERPRPIFGTLNRKQSVKNREPMQGLLLKTPVRQPQT